MPKYRRTLLDEVEASSLIGQTIPRNINNLVLEGTQTRTASQTVWN